MECGIVKAFLLLHRYSSPVGILISCYSHSQIQAQEGPSHSGSLAPMSSLMIDHGGMSADFSVSANSLPK